jgi:hypothetical protein
MASRKRAEARKDSQPSKKVGALFAKKLQVSSEIRALRAQMGKLNEQLLAADAPTEMIVCW